MTPIKSRIGANEIMSCLAANKISCNKILGSPSKIKTGIYENLGLEGGVLAIGDSIEDYLSADAMGWDFIRVVNK